jgi:hypothetical protein
MRSNVDGSLFRGRENVGKDEVQLKKLDGRTAAGRQLDQKIDVAFVWLEIGTRCRPEQPQRLDAGLAASGGGVDK